LVFYIKITQSFNAPVDAIFNILTNHPAFGQVINANIKQVVDGQDANKNGSGSVRRVSVYLAILGVRLKFQSSKYSIPL